MTFQRFAYMDWKKWSIFYVKPDFKAIVDYLTIHYSNWSWMNWISDFLLRHILDHLIPENLSTVAILYISLHWIEKRLLHLIIAHYKTGLLAWISIWHHSTRSLQWELRTSTKVRSCPALAKEQTTFIHYR